MGGRRIAAAAVTALAAMAVLAGCATGAPSSDGAPTTRPPFLTTTPSATPSGTPTAVSPARWDAIVADLAGRGVSATPTLVSAESVQWPNGALGCPTPGTSYIQQVIDGAKVVVTAGGRTWDYRFDGGDTPRLCGR